MKPFIRLVAVTLLLASLSVIVRSVAAEESKAKTNAPAIAPVYTVDSYDPARNPEQDLQMTVKRAKTEHKRIVLQVGGEWCGWCKLMSKYFHQNEKVAAALAKDYLIMEVNFSDQNKNREFLKKYPSIRGYPHLFVLDSDGKLLHSQNTAELEQGKGYNEQKVLEFLAKWSPKKAG